MTLLFRILAGVLVALVLWVVPEVAGDLSDPDGPVHLIGTVVTLIGALFIVPLFLYYAVRGPVAAERLSRRLGLSRGRGNGKDAAPPPDCAD